MTFVPGSAPRGIGLGLQHAGDDALLRSRRRRADNGGRHDEREESEPAAHAATTPRWVIGCLGTLRGGLTRCRAAGGGFRLLERGELLPSEAMERATELARLAALMLVVGSSLEVWPAAGLPLEARSFAIVNRGPTALDDRAVLKIDAPAGETLAAVVAAL